MTVKKREASAPNEWIDALVAHDEQLLRVRLLWRRGSSRYRPMVSPALDLSEFEGAPVRTWEGFELSDTHFEWPPGEDEDPQELREQARLIVEGLWRRCVHWARGLDSRCDFQLRGYGEDGAVLFEVSRRVEGGRGPSEEMGEEEHSPPQDRFGDDFERINAIKDELLLKLTEERNHSFSLAQKASAAAPELISSTRAILERAIEYEQEQVRGLLDQHTGRTEARARAFEAKQQTQRRGMTLEFLRYAVDATLTTVVPTARAMFENWANRSMQVFPEFRCAQQALAYVGMTLTQPQLCKLFNDNRNAIEGFMVLVEEAAKMEDEREALLHLRGMSKVFVTKRFLEIGTPEQQLAGRYIVGRLAMYRLGDYGEPAQE
ncbi:hypothetical protein G6O69_37990 [Pseudenhygromyxa sp. WMMC2535]|uniref:hypothetical protein n=1 Tax=Pseudenhygromyxa sp. WMMC2535 TaxID=2712867 RepID=UPI001552C7F8|nr:hypothetical protein [Pseudenhygromyxa sp. WMMC2535]NVB38214.1 hypothetical protein [Pseudenhygromyxa sp. WMMC2535]NVB41613.1 hypothetical protein [Pseudenhygromyxa sp. WMMC2535]NVB43637.1 hypothetical protein [Pseudenhygromyxa sp. WMMC2535]NVB43662.1 hypothetical protein [Pseudenhygromyxa sp. WMMC2535]